MISYERYLLDNGLRIILHKDETTPLLTVNLLYGVGAKHENENKTGFAHLFEHLMFSGSKNVPSFDNIIDKIGGENNAFTNNDYTNYYLSIPSSQLETSLWLESDRMEYLNINQKSLDVQKNVVIEEFKQRYLNQPYGDVWMLIRDLAYKVHPYKWPTIGKDISHIQDANLQDVKTFYNNFYKPSNAILCIGGNFESNYALELSEKWFGDIPKTEINKVDIPKEPIQKEARVKTVYRDVPQNMIYIVFPMASRIDKDYYAYDLLSDILSNGRSSRFYNSLVKEKELFTEINAFISGDIDNGLFIISGKYRDGIDIEKGCQAIWNELDKIINEDINTYEFQKVKNKFESTFIMSQIKTLERAMNLCYFEYLGDIDMINKEINNYACLETQDVKRIARETFKKENSSSLYYLIKHEE